jgi:DNA-binding response OmpR family regulator
MVLDPRSRARFDLSKASILLLEPNPMGMSILVQIVTGLGAKHLHRCGSVEEARQVALHFETHLMIVDGLSETGEGYDFVRWLRREAGELNLYTPVLLTSAHTRLTDVAKARDCGGHFIVAKPIAPIVMLERIIFISKEGRGFLFSDSYVGPDRRIHDNGPPPNRPGRRREDQLRNVEAESAENGETAAGPEARTPT